MLDPNPDEMKCGSATLLQRKTTLAPVEAVQVLYLLLGMGLNLVQPVPQVHTPAHPACSRSRVIIYMDQKNVRKPCSGKNQKAQSYTNMIYFGIVWLKFRFFSLSPRSLNSSPLARWLRIRGNGFLMRALKTNFVGKEFEFYFGPI
jgi:hypothetical protein